MSQMQMRPTELATLSRPLDGAAGTVELVRRRLGGTDPTGCMPSVAEAALVALVDRVSSRLIATGQGLGDAAAAARSSGAIVAGADRAQEHSFPLGQGS